jgi:dolichol kinase
MVEAIDFGKIRTWMYMKTPKSGTFAIFHIKTISYHIIFAENKNKIVLKVACCLLPPCIFLLSPPLNAGR